MSVFRALLGICKDDRYAICRHGDGARYTIGGLCSQGLADCKGTATFHDVYLSIMIPPTQLDDKPERELRI
jgi:hypothetical protein